MTDAYRLQDLPDSALADATAFITDTWVRSFYHYRPPLLAPKQYKRDQRDLVLRLLKEADVTVVTLPDAPDLFVGWVCRQGPVLHYVYTRHAHREQGHAARLTDGVTITTHRPTSEHCRDWATRNGWNYRPHLLCR